MRCYRCLTELQPGRWIEIGNSDRSPGDRKYFCLICAEWLRDQCGELSDIGAEIAERIKEAYKALA